MQVHVREQELAPAVQHGDAARVHLEERPGARHVQQRLRRGGEEQVVDEPPVVDGQLGERLGQRKHQVGIVDRQDLGQAVFVPTVPPVAAAARAVPVPTGIPVVLGVPARRAVYCVSAQDRRAADFDLAQRAVLLRRQAPTAGPPIARGITPEDVGEREVRRTGRGGRRLRVCASALQAVCSHGCSWDSARERGRAGDLRGPAHQRLGVGRCAARARLARCYENTRRLGKLSGVAPRRATDFFPRRT